MPGAEVGERRVCAAEEEPVKRKRKKHKSKKTQGGEREKKKCPPLLFFVGHTMASKPPSDPLKNHDRYKKIKDLNQGKGEKTKEGREGEKKRRRFTMEALSFSECWPVQKEN